MTVKSTATAVVVKADRGWFTRMVVIPHRRQMNMQEMLTYPLATADGAPTKTAKSALLHILEGKAQQVEDVPASAVWILDGVAILHFMKDVPRTFSSLASKCLRAREIGGVPVQDQDWPDHGSVSWCIHQEPSFVMFAYFGSLFVTHGMECHKLTAGENIIDCNRLDELCAQQEEADTRILLHAIHAASNGHDCIAIKSPDTDVAFLACTLSHIINANMLFCIDTKQRMMYLDMTAIGQSLGEDVCKALPGMHALTGCDSTSAFVWKGKRQAFNYGRVRPKHVRCHDVVW